ncbi:MAG: redoxin family protein [Alteromonadaceae bacterium]|nr:redoxin family protein [Alteromonadaceae bacterium]
MLNNKRLLFILPLTAFLLLSSFLLSGLFSEPRYEVSTTVDKPLPPFALPDVMEPNKIITQNDLLGEPLLLNVWGTWCVTCAIELPYLTSLRVDGIKIVGLYIEQDLDPDFGAKGLTEIQQDIFTTLSRLGNPYSFNIFDQQRDYSLDLGVTGAPETFLVDAQGIVRVHHVGDLNEMVWKNKFEPIYATLN